MAILVVKFQADSEGYLITFEMGQCTEVRFASLLSGGFTTCNKSTRKETGKLHLCAVGSLETLGLFLLNKD